MKIIALILAMLALEACYSRNDTSKLIGEAYPQRPKNKFRYNSYRHRKNVSTYFQTSGLDTDAIYIRSIYDPLTSDTDYTFLRFFATGEVFSSQPFPNWPSDKEANIDSYGKWYMYTLNSKGEVFLEMQATNDFVRWYYARGQTTTNSLIFLGATDGRRLIKNEDKIFDPYLRKKVVFHNRTILWK